MVLWTPLQAFNNPDILSTFGLKSHLCILKMINLGKFIMCFDRSWLTCIYAINQTVLAKTMITPLALPKIVHLLQNKLTHYSEDTGAFIVASLFHSTKTTEATRLNLSPQHKFFSHDPKVNKLSHHNLSNKHKCKHGHWTWSTSIIKKSKTRREGLYYSVQRLQNGVHYRFSFL